jgi:hypothetical protein
MYTYFRFYVFLSDGNDWERMRLDDVAKVFVSSASCNYI